MLEARVVQRSAAQLTRKLVQGAVQLRGEPEGWRSDSHDLGGFSNCDGANSTQCAGRHVTSGSW